ncbi:hypothetical protein Aple_003050 [Acrocarpospora pleiomorpha]|uniref:Uncharacterized protein n=1 Tax=Acrocarpospora pleiomorpha TaxID=90975 RepID=A0A5M3X8I8_9ACTN|nr:hypothetical protein [Acrocarpospora pleiomorpha]GES17410.1 hypothetical protein Aple_003050 [Acrocarpospora pleiomorpha]
MSAQPYTSDPRTAITRIPHLQIFTHGNEGIAGRERETGGSLIPMKMDGAVDDDAQGL